MSRRKNTKTEAEAETAAKAEQFATDGSAVVEVRNKLNVGTSEHINMAGKVTGDVMPSARRVRSAVEIPTIHANDVNISAHKSVLERIDNTADDDRADYDEQGDSIFALDIGTRTIVGVYGNADDDGDKFIMRDFVTIGHTKRAMVDGQVEDIRQVAKIVAEVKRVLEDRNQVRLTKVSIAAAGRALRTCKTSMDFDISGSDGVTFEMVKSMELETIQKAQDELDSETAKAGISTSTGTFHCVGFSVTKYRLDDYSIISLEGHKGNVATIELIATFLPNVVVEGLYSVMAINGLEVASRTLEPIAAMNAIIPAEIRLINIALVDIGAGTSDIAISKDGSIIAYGMATTAGDEITDEIIKHYLVDFDTAEQIKITACGGESFVYKDIFGIEQNVSPEVFASDIRPAVELLAETICVNITNANGSPPAAVFLIGGGSLVCGLPELVAEKLGLDRNKVAIGSERNLRSIDSGGVKMGAEFITPLGIAMTCILNKGYDFSVITLNNRKIRVFDTKKLSVFELLNMTGYKSDEIMGRSGRSLTYKLNGSHTTVKGGNLEPARVKVNGAQASLNTYVQEGDTVEFVPAVCGKNGACSLEDIVDYDKYSSWYVTFGGEKHEIGVDVRVNNKRVPRNYALQPLDEVEVYGILTADDLMHSLGVELDGLLYRVNGRFAEGAYVLKHGDSVEIAEDGVVHTDISTGTYERTNTNTYEQRDLSVPVDLTTASPASHPAVGGAINVTINGKVVVLPNNTQGGPHMFVELLPYADLDMDDPKGAYIMTLNGIEASFQDALSDGDAAVLQWDESDRMAYSLDYSTTATDDTTVAADVEAEADDVAVAEAEVEVEIADEIADVAVTETAEAVEVAEAAEVAEETPLIDWESNAGFDLLFGSDYTSYAVDKTDYPDIF